LESLQAGITGSTAIDYDVLLAAGTVTTSVGLDTNSMSA
jgi:hypothetical protein